MYVKKYFLCIPFKLNGNSRFSVDNERMEFNLENLTVKISFDDDYHGLFKICYFQNKEDILLFYENFKVIISLLNLDSSIWSIQIKDLDENIILDYMGYDCCVVDENENQIIIKPDTILISSGEVKPIQCNSLSDFIKDIQSYHSKLNGIDFDINKKLKTALEFYTNSYFQELEVRFLTYIIILELLKPNIKREGIGKECVDKINDIVKEYRNNQKVKEDEVLKREMDEIGSSLSYIPYRSIGFSIQHLVNNNQIKLDGFEDMEGMIKKSYNVRSKFVHNGKILDEFYECLTFLNILIPELIKKELNKFI